MKTLSSTFQAFRRLIQNFFPTFFRLGFSKRIIHRLSRYTDNLDHKKEHKTYRNEYLADFLRLIVSAGFRPTHIVDIGANRGNWSRLVRDWYPECKYTLFEPQVDLRFEMEDLLEDPRFTVNTMAVGHTCSEMLFTLHDRDDCCSLLWSEQGAKQMGFRQIKIPVVTLDSYVEQADIEWPDLIKIDAEGFDLKVIEGASKCMEHAKLVMIECAVCNPHFENTLLSVLETMNAMDFRLLDLTDLNRPWPNRALWLVEAVFVKKESQLDNATKKSA
jgi:FkbM family methyltransferase